MSLFPAVTSFTSGLAGLSLVLADAEKYAVERKIDPSVLLGARLFPDMFPLVRQVQIATDHAKGALTRLTGQETPVWTDTEASFAELQERIARALAIANTLKEADFEGAETRAISIKLRQGTMDFVGAAYLYGFALPNFYFHCTTAYNILRENGVPLGKRLFMGQA